MNLSSVTTTLLNLLILTGFPFSGSNDSQRQLLRRSHRARRQMRPLKGLGVDYCFMNPPYGGDKTKGKEYKFAYTKGKGNDKRYLVNEDIQSIGIDDDDKVSAGVQLGMATLSAEGGVCCIVLPQGLLLWRDQEMRGAAQKDRRGVQDSLRGRYRLWLLPEHGYQDLHAGLPKRGAGATDDG
jgi:hypothetical protein